MVRRVPLLAGRRIVVAPLEPGSVAIRPRPPVRGLADVGEAVADALRFPLAGPPLAELATRGGTATIVVEPPALPIPPAQHDPRQEAIAAAVAELERAGVPLERQTILVAGGLQRRAGPREIGALVAPEFRRRFRGRLVVHDAEREDPVEVADGLRVAPALVDTDLVLAVTAAETTTSGGPAALLAAASAGALRSPPGASLLESGTSPGWERAVALERALPRRTAVAGVSLALDRPLPLGVLRGYPHDDAAVERLTGSLRRRLPLTAPQAELRAAAVFAGTPSVAHAEALLHAIEVRGAPVEAPLDALVVGVPPLGRERPNPVTVAYLTLGLALRLWRNRPPLADGGTVIVLHDLRRRFANPAQQPYRAFFHDLDLRLSDDLGAAERAAAADERALAEYRRGRSCHPLLPFAEWDACRPVAARAGAVLVAGCRDASAARRLGFVPVHGLGAALEMAHGRAGGRARIGFLLAPPYFPLLVGD